MEPRENRGLADLKARIAAGKSRRVEFLVPFEEKDQAKTYGARWDPARKKWYAPNADVAARMDEHWRRATAAAAEAARLMASGRPRAGSTPAAAAPRAAPAASLPAPPAPRPAPGVTYFAVPFEEKDVAKDMGARWNPGIKMWGSSDPSVCQELSLHFEKRDLSRPVHFPGEDRTYAGNRLFIDLIPRTAWYTNARSMVAPQDWDRVRLHVYGRVNYCCECCGVDTRDPVNGTRMECHERWDWQERGCGVGRQVLRRLVGLCHECHVATHFGLAEVNGEDAAAMAHLVRVNGSTEAEERRKRDAAFGVWQRRSALRWEPDLSILTAGGISIQGRRRYADDSSSGDEWVDLCGASGDVESDGESGTSDDEFEGGYVTSDEELGGGYANRFWG